MKLKPWYDVVKPREDLREGKPLDASEFAVHLDKVRLGTAPEDYNNPERFFDRTYLTDNLAGLAAEVVRRLSGITTETSAVFNMTTQFGGGKTHALTLLYHLAKQGAKAAKYRGVAKILQKAGISNLPDNSAIAVFVGTEFDSITGRNDGPGTPTRRTPWGELAWQIGGAEAYAHVAKHDEEFVEPKGDVISQFLPADRPCLILMDEVLNYVSTYRARGFHNRLYNFIQALSETVRGRRNVVLVGSIPASELSYTADDNADQQRLKNLMDRVGKAVIMSVESETSEIIRRRLFEWDERAVTPDGRVMLTKDAEDVCRAYGDWVQEHRQQLPALINPDHAREQFRASYPLHPMVISVFERKWQTLPRFQQTRGVLRLLALWVSSVYQDGYKGARRDPLITLGTAPLDNATFRAAVFEQLGETRLEAAVTTDITGKKDAHATTLDREAPEAIKKARLYQKVATTIFFESNGGQVGAEAQEASVPEIRLAVGEPETDIGNIETVLESLPEACYYLNVERNRYKFSLKENLNKRFSDRRAVVQNNQVDELLRREIQTLFKKKEFIECVYFPDKSLLVPDRPIVTFAIGDIARALDNGSDATDLVEQTIREFGGSARTFKSSVIWVVADSAQSMRDEGRKLLAWQDIDADADELKLDDIQKRQLQDNLQKSRRDLKESIWRSYRHVMLLGKDGKLKTVDLGLVHSSAAESPISNILNRLSTDGDIEKSVSPNFLARNWPPAFKEWPTKSVRDAFFASPVFPRVLNAESIKDTIVRGVENGVLAYVGKSTTGKYQPFAFKKSLSPADVEFSEDMYVIKAETAQACVEEMGSDGSTTGTFKPTLPTGGPTSTTDQPPIRPSGPTTSDSGSYPRPGLAKLPRLAWSGEVPAQRWMNFYTRVLSRFATTPGLTLRVSIEFAPKDGVSPQSIDETKNALRELGLSDEVDGST